MLPQPVPAHPVTLQFTVVCDVPVTVAVNCCVSLAERVAVVGETEIVTAEGVGEDEELPQLHRVIPSKNGNTTSPAQIMSFRMAVLRWWNDARLKERRDVLKPGLSGRFCTASSRRRLSRYDLPVPVAFAVTPVTCGCAYGDDWREIPFTLSSP